jgi:hypothetical protein
MSTLKTTFAAVAGVALFAATSASFAGRYGDDEIRHWQTVKQIELSKAQAEKAQGVAGRSGEEMTIEGTAGRQPYKKPPFPGFHKPGY